jgi:hypothetical protein
VVRLVDASACANIPTVRNLPSASVDKALVIARSMFSGILLRTERRGFTVSVKRFARID